MTDAQHHLMTVFAEALDHAMPAARAAYLDRACDGNPHLRARIEALLLAHAGAGGFLEPPVGPSPIAGEPTRTHAPEVETAERTTDDATTDSIGALIGGR